MFLSNLERIVCMKTINLTSTRLRTTKKSNLTPRGNVVEINDSIFGDMLEHIRPLLSKDGASEWLIKDHFRNLPTHTVGDFLSLALRKGIIHQASGTYTLG